MGLLSDNSKQTLQQWMGTTDRDFTLLYQGTRDGYQAQTFHNLCDGHAPTVTVASNNSGYVFGAYTKATWRSTGGNVRDTKMFIFRLSQNPQCWKTQGNGYEHLYDHPQTGPAFGNGPAITFMSNQNRGYMYGNGQAATTLTCNQTYMVPAFGLQNVAQFCGGDQQIAQLEVYQVVEKQKTVAPRRQLWRKVDGWTEGVRARLLVEISEYRPYEGIGVEQTRILLLGPVGAGKSSFFNTISSVFRGRVTSQARSGSAQHSLTTMFRTYQIRSHQGGDPMKFRLCDTMGLEESHGLNPADIGYILDGHIPDRFQFNPASAVSPTTPGFNSHPTLATSIHCLAIIVDSSTAEIINQKVIDKLTAVKDAASSRGIPVLVVLTKVDQVCPTVAGRIDAVFTSDAVYTAVGQIASKLGVPKNHVLPVKNYEEETELDVAVDILALTALRQMLRFADDYFDEQMDMFEETGEVRMPVEQVQRPSAAAPVPEAYGAQARQPRQAGTAQHTRQKLPAAPARVLRQNWTD